MSFWKSIKGLQFSYLLEISKLFLRHPLFALTTFKGTFDAYTISQKSFPKTHSKEGKANAFRHALWNILIAKNCLFFSKNIDVVLNWTKTITDKHEELAPNAPLSGAMDLHNNELGRRWFVVLKEKNNKEIITFLNEKIQEAVRIDENTSLNQVENLVFLEN